MPRRRATMHCQDCRYHSHQGAGRPYPHYCGHALALRKMSYDQARTSPFWCPLGHVLPGIPYPDFTPGKDPIPE